MRASISLLGASSLLVLAPCLASAAPFLTCDPYPATVKQPTTFELYLDAATAPVATPAARKNADGSVDLWTDLAPLNIANGKHTFRAKACDLWGCSDYSLPLSFDKSVPGVPAGLRLSLP